MSYRSRVYRQRNPGSREEGKKKPFFSRQEGNNSRKSGFFQAKSESDEAGSKQEKEKPVPEKQDVQKKKEPVKEKENPVQKKDAGKEDDKAVQKKDSGKEEDKAVQKTPEGKEEDKSLQNKDAGKEEEQMQMKSETSAPLNPKLNHK
ncbi:MAG: hypothetical protein EOO09_03320 [Chitinophagaceae bacterium]|nr:MAG: hypothetical protein EOO09_03320 [Chitinophagaceae bacterium]